MQGLFVNEAGALSQISRCAEDETYPITLPVVQDDDEGTFWGVLGGYDALVIVDGEGTMVARFDHADFEEGAAEIVSIVNGLLAGP